MSGDAIGPATSRFQQSLDALDPQTVDVTGDARGRLSRLTRFGRAVTAGLLAGIWLFSCGGDDAEPAAEDEVVEPSPTDETERDPESDDPSPDTGSATPGSTGDPPANDQPTGDPGDAGNGLRSGDFFSGSLASIGTSDGSESSYDLLVRGIDQLPDEAQPLVAAVDAAHDANTELLSPATLLPDLFITMTQFTPGRSSQLTYGRVLDLGPFGSRAFLFGMGDGFIEATLLDARLSNGDWIVDLLNAGRSGVEDPQSFLTDFLFDVGALAGGPPIPPLAEWTDAEIAAFVDSAIEQGWTDPRGGTLTSNAPEVSDSSAIEQLEAGRDENGDRVVKINLFEPFNAGNPFSRSWIATIDMPDESSLVLFVDAVGGEISGSANCIRGEACADLPVETFNPVLPSDTELVFPLSFLNDFDDLRVRVDVLTAMNAGDPGTTSPHPDRLTMGDDLIDC